MRVIFSVNPLKLISYPFPLFIPMMPLIHIPNCFASSIRHFNCGIDLICKRYELFVFFCFHLATFNRVKQVFFYCWRARCRLKDFSELISWLFYWAHELKKIVLHNLCKFFVKIENNSPCFNNQSNINWTIDL